LYRLSGISLSTCSTFTAFHNRRSAELQRNLRGQVTFRMKTSRAVRVGFLALTLLVSISQIGVSVAHIVQVQGEPLASTVVEGTQARPNALLTPAEAGSAKRTRGTPVSGFWNQTYGTGALAEVVSGPMARAASPPGGVPNAFSWNQYFGGPNYMTSVKNQGSCGSCWAFASIGGMEAQYQINKGNPSTGIDLSEQNVLQCSGGSCSGWYLGSTLDFLKNSGTPDEACNPYTASDHACGTGRCSDYLSRTYRVTVWSHISTDTANIKNYIYTQGPVMVWMPVFDDFPWYDAYFWQYYFYGHSPSGSYGGHFVVIVGWDDQGPGTGDDYWMVRNSWGTSGGDVNSGYGGYFYMTQDPTNGFFGIYQEAAIISGVAEPGPVTKTATVTLTETSTSYSYRTTTTTATSYTSTTTTSTSVIYTTVTVTPTGQGAAASNPLAYLGFISLLAVAVGDRVTAGNRWSIPKVRSRMERRCSRS